MAHDDLDDDYEPYDNGYEDDPTEHCSACGAGFDQDHEWDCPFFGDDDDEQ